MSDEQTVNTQIMEPKRPWHDRFVFGALVAGVVVGVVIGVIDHKKYSAFDKMAKLHIETVKATDKNCNDCHLGASFVNLFNHPMVKADDNVITLMMDKAKIKRW